MTLVAEVQNGDTQRRRELADFLHTRRTKLTPSEVGLPAGARRRTPGLRREEVAQLAGIGTTWYARLEQEWDIRVSPTALTGIARALRLTPEERRHLFILADQPLPPHPPPLDEHVSPELQRFLDSINPNPAHVFGRRWDRLTTNVTARRIFAYPELPPYPNNFVWQLFTDPSRREPFPYWEAMAQQVLAQFRADSARYPGDPWFTELIEDLRRTSPEFRQWWSRHDVRGFLDGPKEIFHPVIGRLVFQHTTLQVPTHPDFKLMVYVPLPEADTAAKIQQFLARPE